MRDEGGIEDREFEEDKRRKWGEYPRSGVLWVVKSEAGAEEFGGSSSLELRKSRHGRGAPSMLIPMGLAASAPWASRAARCMTEMLWRRSCEI